MSRRAREEDPRETLGRQTKKLRANIAESHLFLADSPLNSWDRCTFKWHVEVEAILEDCRRLEAMLTELPAKSAYQPASQLMQSVPSSMLRVPVGQVWQLSLPSLGAFVPGAHSRHSVEPVVSW